ncbi:hypothetical protein [Clostridium sp. C2-6-12]|uniref:hypothetical protein n=1 Tax=Clostridium sp. C2-6-12 TaxID=2698832 RepID=UPI00136A48B5|nr:hypothetical protein [Clostridium sp. C2-6-12]
MSRFDNCVKCNKSSCELCSCISADPVDIEKHGARLLTVRVEVNNVCPNKKVAVACIVYDRCNRILAFKGFVTMVSGNNECGKDSCGTIERKIKFVIPDDDDSDPAKLNVSTISNYIYPCE